MIYTFYSNRCVWLVSHKSQKLIYSLVCLIIFVVAVTSLSRSLSLSLFLSLCVCVDGRSYILLLNNHSDFCTQVIHLKIWWSVVVVIIIINNNNISWLLLLLLLLSFVSHKRNAIHQQADDFDDNERMKKAKTMRQVAQRVQKISSKREIDI